ncbi:hypothetical protein ACIPRL_36020 [Streptomyces sp. NPDC090085]
MDALSAAADIITILTSVFGLSLHLHRARNAAPRNERHEGETG